MIRVLTVTAVLCLGLSPCVLAATPEIVRKELLVTPIDPPVSVSKMTAQQITLPPFQKAPLHTHPCAVVGTVVQGTITYQIAGRSPSILTAGDVFYEPANTKIARFDNTGDTPATFTAFYLCDGDIKPLINILHEPK